MIFSIQHIQRIGNVMWNPVGTLVSYSLAEILLCPVFGPLFHRSPRNPYVPRVRNLKLDLPAFVPKTGAMHSLKMLGPFKSFRR